MISKLIKAEYDSGGDLEYLCNKYGVNSSDLDWYKKPKKTKKGKKACKTLVTQDSQDSVIDVIPDDELEDKVMLGDIKLFKKDVVAWCKSKMTNVEDDDISVREVKELVAMIDTVEKSVKPKEIEKPTTTVNVLVQNLMDTEDDC